MKKKVLVVHKRYIQRRNREFQGDKRRQNTMYVAGRREGTDRGYRQKSVLSSAPEHQQPKKFQNPSTWKVVDNIVAGIVYSLYKTGRGKNTCGGNGQRIRRAERSRIAPATRW
jgi:hypothetical protein